MSLSAKNASAKVKVTQHKLSELLIMLNMPNKSLQHT